MERRISFVPLLCGCQLCPPSAVCRMAPPSPTAQPACGETKATEYSHACVPLLCCCQLCPPSAVCRMVPPSPTAQPACGETKPTDPSHCFVPLLCACQLCPPSAVCRMVPPSPTAQPACGETKATEDSHCCVPVLCVCQVGGEVGNSADPPFCSAPLPCGVLGEREILYKTVITNKAPSTTAATLAHGGAFEKRRPTKAMPPSAPRSLCESFCNASGADGSV